MYETASEFLQTAGPWLEQEESVNSLILRIASSAAAGQRADAAPPVMLTVVERREIKVAALMTTPPNLVLLYAPDRNSGSHLATVAEALIAAGVVVRGCMAPSETARSFAEFWAARTGRPATLKTAQRIYELHQVQSPTAVSGRLRVATADDLDLAADWRHQFYLEALGEDDAAGARSASERQIAADQLYFWEDAGRAVCQAVVSRQMRRGSSIGAVYTPPEFRRRGYAGACVAALSQKQLDAGRQFCCLYTDLANPTSNSIYQKIGYVPVIDCDQYRFAEAAQAGDRLGGVRQGVEP
jgi:hypothetical protein